MAYWAELSVAQLRESASNEAVTVWPIGSTEQHGDHLATGFDLLAAEAVCERAAVLEPSVLILPGLPLGASDHWLPLGGTVSLSATTLTSVVCDVARSLTVGGFEHLIIVNGHAGNIGPLLSALSECGDKPTMELVSYWDLVNEEEVAAACVADEGGIGHAGELETSVALYLRKGLLTSPERPGSALAGGPGSKRAVFLRSPRPLTESPSGVYGDPRHARADLGRLVIETAARTLAEHVHTRRNTRPSGGPMDSLRRGIGKRILEPSRRRGGESD